MRRPPAINPQRRPPYSLLRPSHPLSPPTRHDGLGGGHGTPRCLADVKEDGAGGSVVAACPCVPRIARRLAAFRIAAALPFPHGAVARPFSSCPHSSIAPSNRHEGRGAERGGCLFGGDVRRMKKKRAGVRFPSACFGPIARICLGSNRSCIVAY